MVAVVVACPFTEGPAPQGLMTLLPPRMGAEVLIRFGFLAMDEIRAFRVF